MMEFLKKIGSVVWVIVGVIVLVAALFGMGSIHHCGDRISAFFR